MIVFIVNLSLIFCLPVYDVFFLSSYAHVVVVVVFALCQMHQYADDGTLSPIINIPSEAIITNHMRRILDR
jgi:hypothetical protein